MAIGPKIMMIDHDSRIHDLLRIMVSNRIRIESAFDSFSVCIALSERQSESIRIRSECKNLEVTSKSLRK